MGQILKEIQSDAFEAWLRRNLRNSENMFDKMQLKIVSVTIPNCLRIFSISCSRIPAMTQFGRILEQF